MFSHFLQYNYTQPTELRDFPQWHQGIEFYGFWAIELRQQDCLEKIAYYQQCLSSKLHPNYLRQAHIKICASGLLANSFCPRAKLAKQVDHLILNTPSSFILELSDGNSFTTSPYLTLNDPDKGLLSLRKQLNSCIAEDSPCEYIPHVTLGFYDQAYKTSDIIDMLLPLSSTSIKINVTDIIFARYRTCEIQGPYEVLQRISLIKKT